MEIKITNVGFADNVIFAFQSNGQTELRQEKLQLCDKTIKARKNLVKI